jgi:sensory rhodopsin
MNILAVTTSYTFEFTLICMIAASMYFLLERYKLSDKYKSISTLAFITVALAIIEYFGMREFFDLENLTSANVNYPTEFRYLIWLISTPIMLYTFFVLSGFNRIYKKTALVTLCLNFAMIVSGFFAEMSFSNNLASFNFSLIMFAIGFSCWVGIVYIYNSVLPSYVAKVKSKNQKYLKHCLESLAKIVTFGWLIYPAGLLISFYDPSAETALMRELVYNLGDLFNKIGFVIICFFCAVKLSKLRN